MKRQICLWGLILGLVLCGCSQGESQTEQSQYTATFLTLFDTVTTVVGRAESQEAFTQTAQQIHDELLIYHQLFDIYESYDGISNLKTINDAAGVEPVQVDRKIIDLLLDCKTYYVLTDGRVNVVMGSVLELWHDAREKGINDPQHAALPDEQALRRASEHMSQDCLVIDEEASTVFLSDPEARLDVGAVAKGWATQRVSEGAPEGLLLSVGGNVCATGPKTKDTPWVVGIQDPDGGDNYLHTLEVSKGSVVTSGDYQRSYFVDGTRYHHIIDPDTLYPGTLWRSVTVVCQDSGLADALSTALFLLPMEQGLALAEEYSWEAMWVNQDGERFYSPGFEEWIRT